MNKTETLKLALVIAELRQAHAGHANEGPSTFSDAADLLEALAQPSDSVEQEPVGLDEDTLRDMAGSAFETAMAFGISTDSFERLARDVNKRIVAALEQPKQEPFIPDWVSYRQGKLDGAAEKALTQPEQEPVAVFDVGVNESIGAVTFLVHQGQPLKNGDKLYTTPPKRQPLTDEQKRELIKKSALWDMHVHIGWYSAPSKSFVERAIQLISKIEAAHGIQKAIT